MELQIPDCFYRVSVKALILNDARDKFLIARESIGFWGLPGGGLEWGASPQEDLAREIAEEMGLPVASVAANPSYFVTEQQVKNPNIKIANIIYETTLENFDFTPSDECLEIRFVNQENLDNLPVFEVVTKLAAVFR